MLLLIAMTTVMGFLLMACQPMGGEPCSSIDHLARAPGQSTSPPQRDAPQHASAASGIGSSGGERVPELMARIDVLGHDVPLAQKREATRALIAAGKAAVPVLIGALHDTRVYEQRDIVNRMNLPPHLPPPPPLIAATTVGAHCVDLLYAIITPYHASPYAGNFKVYSKQVLRVEDWPAWWAAHEHQSLAELHAELQPLVDVYWQQQFPPMAPRSYVTMMSEQSAGDLTSIWL